MKISTKGRYALRMLTYLAAHQDKGCISLKEISEKENISKKYLEQIVPMLNKAGILRTSRGNRGGYMLSMRAEECTVGAVLRATEGSLAPVACLEYGTADCSRSTQCSTLFVWEGLNKAISDYLDSITIQDILSHSSASDGDNYCI